MIRKGRLLKNAAVALAIVSVFGSSLSNVSAMSSIEQVMSISQYVDGEYEANNLKLWNDSKNEVSMANGYMKSSKIIVSNGKLYLKIVFDSGAMLKEINPSVNNSQVSSENVLNSDGTRSIKFEINDLNDDINLGIKINPFGEFVVDATCSVKIGELDIPSVTPPEEVIPPTPEEDKEEEVVPPPTPEEDKEEEIVPPPIPEEDKEEVIPPTPEEDNSGNNSNTGSNTYKNGYYQGKNILHIDNPTGYAMVRNLLSETTNMEVKDGKTYVTLKMSGSSLMSNVSVKVNGKSTKLTQTSVGNDTVEFKVEVPNASAKLTFSMYVSAMGSTTSFDVTLNQSTIKFISSNEEPTIPNGGSTNNGSNTGTTGSTDNSVVENTAAKGKLYTVKNQVISSSDTGREMARKYLNSSTKIEDVDGKMYATLTFTGVDLMSNHKIYVNGSLVNHSVTSKNSSSVSIRFAIPDINADIEVQVHVIPMNSTVKFGVKLLEDTLTYVGEFDSTNGKLPQTGSLMTSETIMASGGALAMTGALLRRKKK